MALLLRIMPYIFNIEKFAVHGGTAINLFLKNIPRYSVDIDLTYIPLLGREESLRDINVLLANLKVTLERFIPGIRINHKREALKLLCTLGQAIVKIEVNGIKRGLIGEPEVHVLSEVARKDFGLTCQA